MDDAIRSYTNPEHYASPVLSQEQKAIIREIISRWLETTEEHQ